MTSRDLDATLLTAMVQAINERSEIDLDDEVVVMAFLTSKGFTAGDIAALIDRALAEARAARSVANGDFGHTLDPSWGGR